MNMPTRRLAKDMRLAARNATTAAELAIAAPQVIAARLAMMSTPTAETGAECARMLTEKTEAFAAAGLAASGRAAEMGARTAAYLMSEATRLDSTPMAAAERLFDYWSGMTRLSLQLSSAAMAPLHQTATANARRLKR